jgi:uncharacterized protein with PQ loop repeat
MYKGEDDMEELVEYDARKVAKHYLMTWFLPDLISALPMDLLLHVKVYQKTNKHQERYCYCSSSSISLSFFLFFFFAFVRFFFFFYFMESYIIDWIVRPYIFLAIHVCVCVCVCVYLSLRCLFVSLSHKPLILLLYKCVMF